MLKKICNLVALFAIALNFSHPVVFADEGMWTFDNPPLKQWKEKYDFIPPAGMLDKIRLASPKVGGASGAFVSPNGLIATNHHVAANYIARLSTKDRDLSKTGFYAKTLADELKIPDAEVSVLQSFEDVTSRIRKAEESSKSQSEAAAGRRTEISSIETDCTKTTRLRCEVISFYSGGEYWLYRFKQYNDIRLVMAPEEQAAFFGGDYDNFTYPRHDLDFTFLRAYENGKPAETPNYLKFTTDEVKEGDFVIVSGYPGSTDRLKTIAQLKYQRDTGNPLQKKVWELRRKALEEYSKRGQEEFRQAWPAMRSFANSLKRLEGQQQGLLNPRNFEKKEKEEAELKSRITADKMLSEKYLSAWESIEKAYEKLPSRASQIAFSNLSASRLATIAYLLVLYHIETAKPENDRLPEFRSERLASIRGSILSQSPIYTDMESAALTSWLSDARSELGNDDPFIKAALGDAEAAEVAERAIRETKLADLSVRQKLLSGSANDVLQSTDPLIRLAIRVEPVIRELRLWNEKNIIEVETSAGTRIAQARFAVYGKTIPPDANSQLRIEYGRIKGYEEDTTLVPYKTTFYGLFDRAFSFKEVPPFDLAPSVKMALGKIKLDTPLNFVYTADTIGGNSGSPVINRQGELVGLNFDSNLQKLSNRYWYIDESEGSRAVGVHTAGILEALRSIYQAERLIRELTEPN
jgi:hypothetical protein